MIVTVYYDPNNPAGSTMQNLYTLEWTGRALLN